MAVAGGRTPDWGSLAVTGQESTFSADPVVPGLGAIARQEIDARAESGAHAMRHT